MTEGRLNSKIDETKIQPVLMLWCSRYQKGSCPKRAAEGSWRIWCQKGALSPMHYSSCHQFAMISEEGAVPKALLADCKLVCQYSCYCPNLQCKREYIQHCCRAVSEAFGTQEKDDHITATRGPAAYHRASPGHQRYATTFVHHLKHSQVSCFCNCFDADSHVSSLQVWQPMRGSLQHKRCINKLQGWQKTIIAKRRKV